MKEQGILIVFEGPDGSGKATQAKLVKDHLQLIGKSVEEIDFPQYQTSFFGKLVGRMLSGEFGGLTDINPHLASVLYAGDRFEAKEKIKTWLQDGKLVIANRYTCSNMAHQAAKLPEERREEFLQFLETMEYRVFGIPREDLVILLYLPPEIGQKLVDKKEKREHLKGAKRDIHEADLDYLRRTSEAYLFLVKKYPHWVKVDCCDSEGNLMTPEEIHERVWGVLQEKGII